MNSLPPNESSCNVVVGRLLLIIHIPAARSLKDKRRVVKSLISRIQNQHHVAIAEVGDNDKWQVAQIGAAVVSNSADHADRMLAKIVLMVQREPELILTDYETELS